MTKHIVQISVTVTLGLYEHILIISISSVISIYMLQYSISFLYAYAHTFTSNKKTLPGFIIYYDSLCLRKRLVCSK